MKIAALKKQLKAKQHHVRSQGVTQQSDRPTRGAEREARREQDEPSARAD